MDGTASGAKDPFLAAKDPTDEALMKEEAKINNRRRQNAIRKERLLNARKRCIGVDVDALDAQVSEMRRSREHAVEQVRLEKLRSIEIERVLASQVEEEKQMRDFQMEQMKSSWTHAIQTKEDMRRSYHEEPAIDLEKCGPSSAQILSGEDTNRKQRLEQQKTQMQRWIQEQLSEKAYIRQSLDNDNTNYKEMLNAINEYRDAAMKEEADMREYLKQTLKSSNAELAAMQREKKNKDKVEWEATPMEKRIKATSLNVGDYSNTKVVDETGHILRKDLFRGYTIHQRRRFLQENEKLIQIKRDMEESEATRERDWAVQQKYVQMALNENAAREQELRKSLNYDQLSVIREQMDQQRQAREDYRTMRQTNGFGAEFFSNFGTSHR